MSWPILVLNYVSAGQLDEAMPLLEDALRLCKEKLGPEHSRHTLLAMYDNLAGGLPNGRASNWTKRMSLVRGRLAIHH